MKRPLVIGHRGAPHAALENTLDSFRAAIDVGVDMFELDVQQSADGFLVIFHDYDLSRLANDSRLISEMTLDEIQQVDLGGGRSIPVLEEVLDLAKGRVKVNVEIKVPDIEKPVLNVVRQVGILDDILFSSFYHGVLAKIRELEERANTGVLYSQPIEDVANYARSLDANAINPLFFLLEPSIVADAHANGLKVYPWTVNDSEMIMELIKIGVDGIITDCPDICFDALKDLGL